MNDVLVTLGLKEYSPPKGKVTHGAKKQAAPPCKKTSIAVCYWTILNNPGISRQELISESGLSENAVVRATDELIFDDRIIRHEKKYGSRKAYSYEVIHAC